MLYPIGLTYKNNMLYSYWNTKNGLKTAACAFVGKPIVAKSSKNPIITPKPENKWESKATFNPGAVYAGDKVHLIYRAIGNNDISVLGYAASKDGTHIDERSNKPVYLPSGSPEHLKSIAILSYISGWGFGGSEDPRITKMGNRIYMTYTDFSGYPRVALTSIAVRDFLERNWNWKEPVIISPPGEVHKNWVIFPEKINGKYAILHSISPKISIDYFDSLDFNSDTYIKSRHHPSDFHNFQIRGVGAPPIKTKEGWLILYHAIDKKDASKYKLKAMILDYKNPTKILHRSMKAIISPEELYENHGLKSGIVYCCGAVVIHDRLYLYYGGADTVTCVATADLNEFLNKLKHHQEVKFEPVIIR